MKIPNCRNIKMLYQVAGEGAV